jgi:hypothetical protein
MGEKKMDEKHTEYETNRWNDIQKKIICLLVMALKWRWRNHKSQFNHLKKIQLSALCTISMFHLISFVIYFIHIYLYLPSSNWKQPHIRLINVLSTICKFSEVKSFNPFHFSLQVTYFLLIFDEDIVKTNPIITALYASSFHTIIN